MPSQSGLIGITGATGTVGGMVARRLSQQGVTQRLIVRDLDRAPVLSGAEPAQVAGGYRDTAGMSAALRGVQTLFLVSGHLSEDRVGDHQSAIDAALEAGVRRIVYLSFLNAAADATFVAAQEHYHTEQSIRASGIAFTFLRDSLYADAAARYCNAADRVIRGPAGDGRISFVSQEDIAEAAAVVLTAAGHEGATYDMTGPEALSWAETAALLSEITGQPCRYYNETLDEARQSRAVYNASEETVNTWISTYLAVARGELSLVSEDLPRLTGHPAQTLREYLRLHPESYQHLL